MIQNPDPGQLETVRLRIISAVDQLEQSLQEQFNSRELLQPLVKLIVEWQYNLDAWDPLELCASFAISSNMKDISTRPLAKDNLALKRSVLYQMGRDQNDAPQICADIESLRKTARNICRDVLGNSAAIAIFLEWYLGQAQDITLRSAAGIERTVSRFKAYGSKDFISGHDLDVQRHMRRHEKPLVDLLRRHLQVDEALELCKAASFWIWQELRESPEGQEAWQYHLMGRGSAIANCLIEIEDWESPSLIAALLHLDNAHLLVTLGVRLSGEALGVWRWGSTYPRRSTLELDTLQYLLSCDSSMPEEQQKLLLPFIPTLRGVRSKFNKLSQMLQIYSLRTAASYIASLPQNKVTSHTIFLEFAAVYQNLSGDPPFPEMQVLAEHYINDDDQIKIPEVLSGHKGALDIKIIALCDKIINLCCDEQRVNHPDAPDFSVWPPAIDDLIDYETENLDKIYTGTVDRLQTTLYRRVSDLCGIVVHERRPEPEWPPILNDYPYAVYSGDVELKSPPREQTFHARMHKIIENTQVPSRP